MAEDKKYQDWGAETDVPFLQRQPYNQGNETGANNSAIVVRVPYDKENPSEYYVTVLKVKPGERMNFTSGETVIKTLEGCLTEKQILKMREIAEEESKHKRSIK